MRCSLPAMRSIWRLALLEMECRCCRCSGSVKRGWLLAPVAWGSAESLALVRGMAGGGGVDGRRLLRAAVVASGAGVLGVELVGFHRRAAER